MIRNRAWGWGEVNISILNDRSWGSARIWGNHIGIIHVWINGVWFVALVFLTLWKNIFSHKDFLIVNGFGIDKPILWWVWPTLSVRLIAALPSEIVVHLTVSISLVNSCSPFHDFDGSDHFDGAVHDNIWKGISESLVCSWVSWDVGEFHVSGLDFVSSERVHIDTYFLG